jgi:hypothetical protein
VAVTEPLFWFEAKGVNRIARVWLATHDSVKEIKDESGICYCTGPDDADIYINVSESERNQEITVLHEVLHSCTEDLRRVSDKTEERVFSHIDVRLYDILINNGLCWPPRPEGYVALRRKALRMYNAEYNAECDRYVTPKEVA